MNPYKNPLPERGETWSRTEGDRRVEHIIKRVDLSTRRVYGLRSSGRCLGFPLAALRLGIGGWRKDDKPKVDLGPLRSRKNIRAGATADEDRACPHPEPVWPLHWHRDDTERVKRRLRRGDPKDLISDEESLHRALVDLLEKQVDAEPRRRRSA